MKEKQRNEKLKWIETKKKNFSKSNSPAEILPKEEKLGQSLL